jgi:outer membrane murein-binding lipoprotein Lpp
VDVQQVIDAVVAYDTADIAAAVKAGTMTQAQADERLANLTQHVTDEVNGVDTGRGGIGGRGHGHGMSTSDISDAAKVLGMTDAELTAELQSGTSVAAVAESKGIELQKVIDAMVAADTAKIEAAVTAGTMTQAQADERLANLEQHVTDEVNATGLGHGSGRGHGHGPRDGSGTDAQEPTTTPSTGTGTGTGTSTDA